MTATTSQLIAKHSVPGTDAHVYIMRQDLDVTVGYYRVGDGAIPREETHHDTEDAARVTANMLWLRLRETGFAPVHRPAEVPAGRYAVNGADGVLKFYVVDRPTEGRWAGYTFLSVQASDDLHPIKGRAARESILAAIAVDPRAASVRYGRELGVCGVCGRTLTDADSRAAGIGPVCAVKF